MKSNPEINLTSLLSSGRNSLQNKRQALLVWAENARTCRACLVSHAELDQLGHAGRLQYTILLTAQDVKNFLDRRGNLEVVR